MERASKSVLAHSTASTYRKGNQSPFNFIIKLRWPEMKHFIQILHFIESSCKIFGWKLCPIFTGMKILLSCSSCRTLMGLHCCACMFACACTVDCCTCVWGCVAHQKQCLCQQKVLLHLEQMARRDSNDPSPFTSDKELIALPLLRSLFHLSCLFISMPKCLFALSLVG